MWEQRIEPFLARYALLLVLCLAAIASARIISTYNVFSTTGDEPAHVACGLEYLTRHVYLYETQHPPLTRAMIALLPYLSGTRTQGKDRFQTEGWAVITYQNHPERTVFLMRLGNLPFFLLGCLVVFYWTRRFAGAATGVIAVGLFTLIPTVLAHAGLATTDMGLAACLGAAFLAMLVWAEEPTVKHSVLFGLCTALALLSKFTSLGFLPVSAALAFLFYLAVRTPGDEQAVATRQGAGRDFRNRNRSLPVHDLGGVFFLFRQGPLVECLAACVGVFRRHTGGDASQPDGASGVPAG